MKLSFIIFVIILFSCVKKDSSKSLFNDLRNKEDVVIVLSHYGLDRIPAEVGLLTKTRNLTISKDSLKGWTIYPPVSAMRSDPRFYEPPFRFVPQEITNLKDLKTLGLIGLDIKELPADFSKLENIEYLDLSMNKLDISKELPQLKKLAHLKSIQLFGNKIDPVEIEVWKNEKPELTINY